MGGGGVGGGTTPELQRPEVSAMSDFHGEEGKDPKNPDGKLPPVKRRRKR